jgi:acyl-CoA oxidase
MAATLPTAVSATLTREREGATFKINDLIAFFHGSFEAFQNRAAIEKQVAAKFEGGDYIYRSSKYERYLECQRRNGRIREMQAAGELSHLSKADAALFKGFAYGPDGHPVGIHYAMFLPALKTQASDEQKAAWLPAAESLSIVGCYGQTEIAHGSDVQGLQTTATYVKETESFVLHSPSVESTKWWPAALGRTSTHAIIHARLLLPGVDGKIEDKGVKAFMVQMRDLDTHRNLPGIESGDIGATLGIVGMEEGFARFDHVSVPRIAMLARYQQVLADGSYVEAKRAFAKRGYATMMFVRAGMVKASFNFLAKASTIAVRFCAVRRQFPNPDKPGSEMQVLDYQGVQMRVLPWLATAFALKFTGDSMILMHGEMEARVDASGDTSMVGETHAIASCLKAVTTSYASNGIEELRRACGGHGYSSFSGLDHLYGNSMVNFTGEGENYMIVQQCTSYLLKNQSELEEGRAKDDTPYLSFLATSATLDAQACTATRVVDFLDPDVQLAAFAHRAARKVQQAHESVQDGLSAGNTPDVAKNGAQWEGIRSSWAFGEWLILRSFIRGISKVPASCRAVVKGCCDLFAVFEIEKNAGDYLSDGYMTRQQVRLVKDAVKNLLNEIRPNAVALVDSFGLLDIELNSAIGRYDGNVYETLLDWARKEPMNEGPVVAEWELNWLPFFKSARARLESEIGKPLSELPGVVQGHSAPIGKL